MTLACQRHLFDIPRDLCYLNGAYMTPLPRPVREAAEGALQRRAAPWNIGAADFFEPAERARRLIAELIGASPERIALVPSSATAVATVARNVTIGPGRAVVMLAGQFPSNVYSWRRLASGGAGIRIVEAPVGPDRARRWNERLLSSIDRHTALVAVETAHWTDGTLFDVAAIGRRCREVDAWLVVDATQSIGIEAVDVGCVDALIAHPYKSLLAQYGLAFAYFGERMAGGMPLEESWLLRRGSEDFSRLVDYEDQYAPGMRRYDTSTRANLCLVDALTAALELFAQWHSPRVRSYCAGVSRAILDCARSAGYTAPEDGEHAAHLFGIRPPAGTDLDALRGALQARRVYVSVRGDSIRVSTHVYNDEIDVERFSQVLRGRGPPQA